MRRGVLSWEACWEAGAGRGGNARTHAAAAAAAAAPRAAERGCCANARRDENTVIQDMHSTHITLTHTHTLITHTHTRHTHTRRVIILVQAGAPVDSTIEKLCEHMEPGDIIIDGGNEWCV